MATPANVADLVGQHKAKIDEVKAIRYDDYGAPRVLEAADEKKVADLLDASDVIQGQIEAAIADDERKAAQDARIETASDWHTKSAGRLGGMGRGGSETKDAAAVGAVEKKNGWYGAEVKGVGFVEVYNEDEVGRSPAIKATMEPGYKSAFRHYLKAMNSQNISAAEWALLNAADGKALTEGTDSAGGFLVPIQMVAQVIMRKPGSAVMDGRATVINATSDRVLVPRLKAATTDATMYASAVAVTDVGETPSETTGETEPVFDQLGVNIHMLKAFTKLSRNLIADSAFNVESLLADQFGLAFLLGKDDRHLTGTGINQPLGIVNDTSIGTTNSGAASTLTADGVKNMVNALAPQYQGNSTIVLSQSALTTIRLLKDGVGRYLWDAGSGGLVAGIPPTIEGRPYIVTNFLDTVAASAIPMFIGDLSAYWVIERQMYALEVLRELYAPQNMIGYQGFHRYSGLVTNPQAFRTQTVSA